MEHKKMVEKDYTDPETGLRFVEDIRGSLHLVHMMGDMNMPTPVVNVEAPVINIPAPVVNVETQSPVTNNYYSENDYSNAERIVLYTKYLGLTWPSTTQFNRIRLDFNSPGYLNYTVPFGKEFHIVSVIMTQLPSTGISYLGIFLNGNFLFPIPLTDTIIYEFESPMKFLSGSFVEPKFMPHKDKVDLGLTIIGYTI